MREDHLAGLVDNPSQSYPPRKLTTLSKKTDPVEPQMTVKKKRKKKQDEVEQIVKSERKITCEVESEEELACCVRTLRRLTRSW